MNVWLPQASYLCGNFSDASYSPECQCYTENQHQVNFGPSAPQEVSLSHCICIIIYDCNFLVMAFFLSCSVSLSQASLQNVQ